MTRLLTLLSDPRTPLTLAAGVAILRVAYVILSHVVAPYPRLRAVVEAIAALAPDLFRATAQLLTALAGRPVTLEARAPDYEATRLRAELADALARHRELGRPTLAPSELSGGAA